MCSPVPSWKTAASWCACAPTTAQTKLRSIVSLVQTADSLKSEGQSHMEDLANKIVPWNFLLAGLVALTTRSLIKTSAALMVDYSCALKLTGSVAVMTAMSDAAKMGVMVKGAKYFESFAKADTIVFDKTGTLTEAQPRLACVLTTDGWSEDEILRLSACLEEHFPHPVARAVVNAAASAGSSTARRPCRPSSTSWRTASLRPLKGVAPSSVPRTLYLRMRARSSSPTLRSKSSPRCRAVAAVPGGRWHRCGRDRYRGPA